MAPECFLNSSYDKSVDVFGLGLVFLAMLSFKPGDEYLAPKSGKLFYVESFSVEFAHNFKTEYFNMLEIELIHSKQMIEYAW